MDDALHYLARTEERFDAVIVDGWGPESSPSLYTRTFHEWVLTVLAPEGVLWAKLSPLQPESLAAIEAAAVKHPGVRAHDIHWPARLRSREGRGPEQHRSPGFAPGG